MVTTLSRRGPRAALALNGWAAPGRGWTYRRARAPSRAGPSRARAGVSVGLPAPPARRAVHRRARDRARRPGGRSDIVRMARARDESPTDVLPAPLGVRRRVPARRRR